MKYFGFTLLLVLVLNTLTGQYNYGLEICDHDVKIRGKIDASDAVGNIVIGENAGINIDTVNGSATNNPNGLQNTFVGYSAGQTNGIGWSNTFMGNRAGKLNRTGIANTFIGSSCGNSSDASFNTFIGSNTGTLSKTGDLNTMIGSNAGLLNENGAENVYIGALSGFRNLRSGNVFIGYESGFNELDSARLYIENSSSSNPLIYGEFDNDIVQINGSLKVTDTLNLAPQATPNGTCNNNGDLVYGIDNELYLCKNGDWKQMEEQNSIFFHASNGPAYILEDGVETKIGHLSIFDPSNSFEGSVNAGARNAFIAPEEGYYHFDANVELKKHIDDISEINGYISLGQGVSERFRAKIDDFGETIKISRNLYLKVGDKVELSITVFTGGSQVFLSSGGNLPNGPLTMLSGFKIGGKADQLFPPSN